MISRSSIAVISLLSGVLGVLSIFGIRDIVLKRVDCVTCRRVFALLLRPSDLNAPIAVGIVENGTAKFSLFPTYVGPYFVQIYRSGAASRSAQIDGFECDADLRFEGTTGDASTHGTRSKFGSGVIAGGIFVPPALVVSNRRLACRASLRDKVSGLIVISRASEL